MDQSPHVRVINCKDVVSSHGGYRSTGQVWAYMAQELTEPSAPQFFTLTKSPEALNAVFRVTGEALTAAARTKPQRLRAHPGRVPRRTKRTRRRGRE
jgi:hypothetical protein